MWEPSRRIAAGAARRGYGEDGIYFDHRGDCWDSADLGVAVGAGARRHRNGLVRDVRDRRRLWQWATTPSGRTGHALALAVTGRPASCQSGSPPSSGRAENPLARKSRTASGANTQ